MGVDLGGPLGPNAETGGQNEIGAGAGVKFGHRKLNKFAHWQARYNYRHLERDAWPDFLPDSNFADGGTNVKGHEVEVKFGLSRNVTLGLDYYFDVKPIKDPEYGKQKLLQVDLLLKF